MIKQFLVVFTLLLFFKQLSAQSGTVKGTLLEELNGQKVGLPFANVFLEGTTIGGTTNFDGNFQFVAPVGTHIIVASFMGYETFKQQINVVSGTDINIEVEMKPEGVAIEDVNVVAKVNRESEVALMLEQKNATIAVDKIGARQLSTQGVSDAAGAVVKITGITKQESSNSLFVRGLGDRYNTTTLNGLPLPSNNAWVKNINLELFSTDVISHINIEKTYSSNLYGDFGGANIDIVSKRHDGNPFLTVEVKSGVNTNVLGSDEFYLQGVESPLGFNSYAEPNANNILNRNNYGFSNNWNPVSKNAVPNIGLGISGGKTFDLTASKKLNSFFTISFDNSYSYTKKTERNISGADFPLDNVQGEKFKYNTQTTGMFNLNYSAGNNEVYYNGLMMNSSGQEMSNLYGRLRDVSDNALRRQSKFERNLIVINQLLGEHKINETTDFNWGLAYNYINNSMPDRMRNTFSEYDSTTNIGSFDSESVGQNYRYFHQFTDNEVAVNSTLDYRFGEGLGNQESRAKLSVGYSGRYKLRSFNSKQFNHDMYQREGFQLVTTDVDNVDGFINNDNFLAGEFNVSVVNAGGKPGFIFEGTLLNNSVFAVLVVNLTDKLLLVGGVRIESIYQEIVYLSSQNLSGKKESVDYSKISILPSLSARYSLTEKQNLRFAASKTYTLPQIQEMPFIQFETETARVWGNPNLYPSDVYNVDLKWEYYPTTGEVFSATVFGKYIINPINKFVVNGTLNEYTKANTGNWAYAYGLELDAKKNLIKINTEQKLKKLFVGGNLTLMSTMQDLQSEKVQDETEYKFFSTFQEDREILQGAAPIIANFTLGYTYKWNQHENALTSSVVYNYVSSRLFAIGHSSLGNKVDQAINTLDLVIKATIKNFEFGVKAKNILNPTYDRIQENELRDWVVHSNQKGTGISASISYKF